MIYLMRHGETQTSGKKQYIGQMDIPLNETGMAMAEKWRDALKYVYFDRIISSDLSRTRETARIIAGNRPIPVEEIPALREIDLGGWDGEFVSTIKADHFNEWQKRGDHIATFRTPQGESFADLQNRALPPFREIAESCAENVLIVAHAGVNRTLLCAILGMPLKNLFMLDQSHSCLNIIGFKGTWRVHTINDKLPEKKISG